MKGKNTAEYLVEIAQENQTRKILALLEKCQSLEEYEKAVEEIRLLIED